MGANIILLNVPVYQFKLKPSKLLLLEGKNRCKGLIDVSAGLFEATIAMLQYNRGQKWSASENHHVRD